MPVLEGIKGKLSQPDGQAHEEQDSSGLTYQGAFTTYFTPLISYLLPFLMGQLSHPPDDQLVDRYIKETNSRVFLHDVATLMNKYKLRNEWEEYLEQRWKEAKGELLDIKNPRRLKCKLMMADNGVHVQHFEVVGDADSNSVRTMPKEKKFHIQNPP